MLSGRGDARTCLRFADVNRRVLLKLDGWGGAMLELMLVKKVKKDDSVYVLWSEFLCEKEDVGL